MDAPTSASAGESLDSDFLYGWDLLYKTVENKIGKKADVLIILAHFMLTKHCKFRCIGIGDDKRLPENETGSELLPDQWNDDSSKYSLRYVHNNVLYLLLAYVAEGVLIINLLDVSKKDVYNLCIMPDSVVADLKGGIMKTMPTAMSIIQRFRSELCEPVFADNSRVAAPAASLGQINQSPAHIQNLLFIDEPRQPEAFVPQSLEPPPFGYPDVGRGDLDPLSGGPGNIFRFPTNPRPIPDLSAPDPDHEQPPNWNPDEYM